MREIEFRIWDKELKEMHYLSLEDLCEDNYWYDGETDVWSVLYDCNHKNERFVINQYIGIKDKNGKKMFEGDIVKYHAETYTKMWDIIGVVEYYNASYGIVDENDRHFLEFNSTSMYVRWYEVIGNIYDNPELLEVEE